MKRFGVLSLAFLLAAFTALLGTRQSASADLAPIFQAHLAVQEGESAGVSVGHVVLFSKYDGTEIDVMLETAGIEPVSLSIDLDDEGHVTRFQYDLQGRLIPVVQSEGHVYRFTLTSIDFGGTPLSEIIDVVAQGNTYVNVHTNDGVQIRGQIIVRPVSIRPF